MCAVSSVFVFYLSDAGIGGRIVIFAKLVLHICNGKYVFIQQTKES